MRYAMYNLEYLWGGGSKSWSGGLNLRPPLIALMDIGELLIVVANSFRLYIRSLSKKRHFNFEERETVPIIIPSYHSRHGVAVNEISMRVHRVTMHRTAESLIVYTPTIHLRFRFYFADELTHSMWSM
jgi:hypothetical protein